jgi:hypothetical protein
VIRNIERPGVRLEEFNSGTEMEVGRPGAVVLPVIEQPAQPALTTPPPPGVVVPAQPQIEKK